MRTYLTREEAQGLAASGKALVTQKSVVVFEIHYPEFIWDERFGIYKLTCFVSDDELWKDLS